MTAPDKSVDLYFDFISPYSWLAFARIEDFVAANGVSIRLRPVVYAAILKERGLIGPAEEPTKRRYTYLDVLRSARTAGRTLVGPPTHPFLSLKALRLVTGALPDEALAMRLAIDLSAACWEEGRDLADRAVLMAVAEKAGMPTTDFEARLNDPAVKQSLRESTDEALAVGVFGVPTFRYRGELFWGQDRMGFLADVLQGRSESIDAGELSELLNRPKGVERRR